MEGAAGGGGFRTREPQGRMGKQGRGGREAIEKQRLAQRVEGFERYEDPGKLTEFEHSAAGHAPEAERFDKDFAVVEQHTREKDRQRHGAIIGARRQERLDREEERWQVTEQSRVYVLWASSLAPASPHTHTELVLQCQAAPPQEVPQDSAPEHDRGCHGDA